MKTNRKLRARNEAIRMIADREGIDFALAAKLYPRARMQVLFEQPRLDNIASWFKRPNGKYYRVKEGKKPTAKNTEGKGRSLAFVKADRARAYYWNLVRLYSLSYDVSIAKARKIYSGIKAKNKKGSKAANEWFLIELGVFSEEDVVSP